MGRARLVTVAMVTSMLTMFGGTARAQDALPERLDLAPVSSMPAWLNASSGVRLPELEQWPPSIASRIRIESPMAPIVPKRPKLAGRTLLGSLYTSTAIMQGLDLHSTLQAFRAGAVEGNPLMAGVTRNRAAFIATKVAVTAVTMIATRKLAKKNKVAAIITVIAVNSAYAWVAKHNYDLARRR